MTQSERFTVLTKFRFCFNPDHFSQDSQTADLLAALAERGIYSRGDFEEWLAGYGPGFLAAYKSRSDAA